MAEKSNLFDYESLPARRQRKSVDGDDFRSLPLAKDAEPAEREDFNFKRQPVFAEIPLASQKAPSTLHPAQVESKEIWSVRSGHSLTFVGLFLFTCLVFFRPYEFSPNLKWLSTSAFWVAAFTILVFILTQLGLENRISARPREVKLILLLLSTAVLSIPRALDPLRAWNSLTDYLKVVLIFIIMVNVLRTEARLRILILLSLIAGCVLSVAAISDYWTGRLTLQGLRIQGVIGGLFDNPNDLALHLVTAIPIAIALLFSSRNLFGKTFYLFCGLLMIAGLVATFSRGGFLGLTCALSLAFWRLARTNRWLLTLLLPFALIGFIIASPSGYLTRISTTNDGSAIARTDDLKRSIIVAVHHPILGVGMNNYTMFSNNNLATHNAYTQVGAEMGLIAMALYILFMITPLKHLRIIIRETSAHRKSSLFYLAVGLEASLVGYMVSSFFASVAYLWYIYYLVAYAICLRRIYGLRSELKTQGITFGARV